MTPRSDDVAPRTLEAEHVQSVQLTARRQLWTLLLRPRADGPAIESEPTALPNSPIRKKPRPSSRRAAAETRAMQDTPLSPYPNAREAESSQVAPTLVAEDRLSDEQIGAKVGITRQS